MAEIDHLLCMRLSELVEELKIQISILGMLVNLFLCLPRVVAMLKCLFLRPPYVGMLKSLFLNLLALLPLRPPPIC